MPLERFHPLVARWFEGRFAAPTPAQAAGWPAIAAGEDTLIAAPTGSGKTLAAFLWCLDRLTRAALADALPAGVDVVYVSPLKALGNDVARNLQVPLAGIRAEAERDGLAPPPIRVGVRSGDTSSGERGRMAKSPPHVLVTTPESLYILLTSERGRAMLAGARTVILDEIHAVAATKRGAHQALTLERLDALVEAAGHRRPVRIGLSATQKPIERVARLLVGTRRPLPRVVDAGHRRPLDLAIEAPDDELAAVTSAEQMGQVYDRVAALVGAHRTTLVFANTRRMVERVAHALQQRLGDEQVAAHHGSLAKEKRLRAEQRLKHAEVKCVVATASLELGIDVGDVDLVVQLGSPRCIATFLQRVGRSGHAVDGTPKGRLFALTRDQAVECAALVRAVRQGDLDEITLRPHPLDVLAQQVVAETACRRWSEDALFDLVTGAAPYADLPRAQFDGVLEMLGEGIATVRGRHTAWVLRDRVNGEVRARRGARLAALTSGGAIPERADYQVVAEPDELVVGTVDEDFAVESMPGDVFLLGSTSWRVKRVESGRVRVEAAPGATPTVPFWFGEAPARTDALSDQVSALRSEVAALLQAGRTLAAVADWLVAEAALPAHAAQLVALYLADALRALGALPTRDTLIAERFFDEAGGMQLVLHAPLGGRINRAWGLALRKRFCVSFNFELQAAATDDGLVISLGPHHSFPLAAVFDFLSPDTVRPVLTQAVLTGPAVFPTRWRWNANRSLAVLRARGGRRVPPPIQRMQAEDLLAAVFPTAAACQENVHGPIEPPDHPLVTETLSDCLTEVMDVDGLRDLIGRIRRGEVRTLAVETPEASPLSHEILNANPYAFLDDAPLEERRTQAVALRRRLGTDVAGGLGALDAEAIAAVADEVRARPQDPDELHDLLLELVLLPDAAVEADWRPWLAALQAARRVVQAAGSGWVAAERATWVATGWPGTRFDPAPPPLPGAVPDLPVKEAAKGHLAHLGPVTAPALAARLAIEPADADAALAALEADGVVLRGRFTPGVTVEEWCDRRVLARIHRRTIGRLRAEIEPVSAADFMRFLFEWHGVGTLDPQDRRRRTGPEAAAHVIEQLQGFELPAGAWEAHVLPARLRDYEAAWLDGLCLSGRVTWGRLAPRTVAAGTAPNRAAPVTLAFREDLPWLLVPAGPLDAVVDALSAASQDVLGHLEGRGASFANEIQRGTGRPAAEVEEALWALVAAGLVTADGFGALRGLLRSGRQHRKDAAPSPWWTRRRVDADAAGGRWSLLRSACDPAPEPEAAARQLLARYGVVFRELLVREAWAPPWRVLLPALRGMEARGEVRGGRFVSGFVGEQYAAPPAVPMLRGVRRRKPDVPEYVRLSAADPLNLVGITSPGPRLPAVVDNAVLYRDGVPVATREGGAVVQRVEVEGLSLGPDLRPLSPVSSAHAG